MLPGTRPSSWLHSRLSWRTRRRRCRPIEPVRPSAGRRRGAPALRVHLMVAGAVAAMHARSAYYEASAGSMWDAFYAQHEGGFFKDRHWLFTEFAELTTLGRGYPPAPAGDPGARPDELPHIEHASRAVVLEVGCGAGNSLFPLLEANRNSALFVYGCDISPQAVRLVCEHPAYDRLRCAAFVHDIAGAAALPLPTASVDAVLLVFTLSAIHPSKMRAATVELARVLKPNGVVLFRDYGRYDLAQLRFKQGHYLGHGSYVRGDGTLVYFFTEGAFAAAAAPGNAVATPISSSRLISDPVRAHQMMCGNCLRARAWWKNSCT